MTCTSKAINGMLLFFLIMKLPLKLFMKTSAKSATVIYRRKTSLKKEIMNFPEQKKIDHNLNILVNHRNENNHNCGSKKSKCQSLESASISHYQTIKQ